MCDPSPTVTYYVIRLNSQVIQTPVPITYVIESHSCQISESPLDFLVPVNQNSHPLLPHFHHHHHRQRYYLCRLHDDVRGE
jgi:hypothetical protein